MRRLVLIDGHAILHRAFHALPPTLSNASGQPTNAVYGFTTMLLKILADLKPDFLAVAFDLPAATFRQQMYTAYQNKRPEMDGNLKDQVTLAHELLEALKIPFFEVAGYEADDCIGTLAAQAVRNETKVVGSETKVREKEDGDRRIEVYIVTGDRDMLQLVNSQTKVYVPIKGLSETKTYDERLVEEEFGVKPSQWVDVKALKGDASDNYPGVAGIGPKTACELIAKFGTLENLYGNLGNLGHFGKPASAKASAGKSGEKLAKKLAEGAEAAGLGKKLAQIATDVPIHLSLEDAQVAKIDWQNGLKYMRNSLGFKSIPERIEKEIFGKSETKVVGSEIKDRKMEKGKKKKESDGQMELI